MPVPSPGTTSATLLLNATYEPLCVVSSRRAIVLVLAEMGWALPHPPRTPSGAAWRLLGTRTVDPRWREWLGVPESVSA